MAINNNTITLEKKKQIVKTEAYIKTISYNEKITLDIYDDIYSIDINDNKIILKNKIKKISSTEELKKYLFVCESIYYV